MKKIFSMAVITGLLILLSGCEDWLDIRPENEVVLEDFWQDESHVMQVLAACYQSLTEGGAMDRILMWGEVRSDHILPNDLPDGGAGANMLRMMNFDVAPNNGYAHWGPMYATINYCNTFLHFAPDVVARDENFSENRLRSLTAEVLTIRALTYFYLVRSFRDVPWIEEPSIDDDQDYRIPKSTEDEILDRLEEDLLYALTYARENFETQQHTKGRITRNAIRALLTDIYLWREKYEECVAVANDIISDPQLNLVPGESVLSQVFYTGNSTESIFELQFDTDNRPNRTLYEFYGGSGNMLQGHWQFNYGLVSPTGMFRIFNRPNQGNVIESKDDIRRKDFIRPMVDMVYVFKYIGLRMETLDGFSSYFYRTTSPNWIFYRLSDIKLMKAEALIQLGEAHYAEAMDLINTIYMRSNVEEDQEPLQLGHYNSRMEMEGLLYRERQRELMFEGKRWFDLMRMARRENSPGPVLNVVARKVSNIPIDKLSSMDALYLPIHIDELRNNRALEQNPYYLLSDQSITW